MRMRIRATLLLAVVSLVVVSAAPAFGAIRILRIEYNPPGPNTGTNRNVNKEFVVLKNMGHRRISLAGWRLRDSRPNRYLFDDAFSLAAGKRVKIHTGRGDDDRNDLYWGFDSYIWDDRGDAAILLSDTGYYRQRCHYSAHVTSPVRCSPGG